ncbi:MAG TPA: anti-sigma factor antagonist [Crocinitomix sp.]|nr:anti-sigma factor antagonist [Crocinitomix sp.]
MSLKIKSKTFDNYSIITLSGKGLSEEDFSPLFQTANNLIESNSPNLILDLQALTLINSLGLNTLIKLFTKSRNAGGEMYIVNISGKINQVLLLTKLNTVLNIATSIDDAKQNFE